MAHENVHVLYSKIYGGYVFGHAHWYAYSKGSIVSLASQSFTGEAGVWDKPIHHVYF